MLGSAEKTNTTGQLIVNLFSKYSKLCDHDTSRSRTDRLLAVVRLRVASLCKNKIHSPLRLHV